MIEDQVALVTGGGRGIGSALAHALADAGAKVAILARSSAEVMRSVDAIVSRGGRALGLVADVTDRASIERSVQEARVALGHIDLLINNAGISDPRGEFWELDIDDWWRVQEVNLRGVALVTRAVLPEMIARRSGRVINVASDIAERATRRNLAYASSKAAVIRFTENLAVAARPHGVYVFALSPGLVRTRLTEASWQSMVQAEAAGRSHPDGLVASDWSSPELVARLVLDLASGVADDLTGRYIHARKDDVAEMLARIEEIRAQQLYALKIRKLSNSG